MECSIQDASSFYAERLISRAKNRVFRRVPLYVPAGPDHQDTELIAKEAALKLIHLKDNNSQDLRKLVMLRSLLQKTSASVDPFQFSCANRTDMKKRKIKAPSRQVKPLDTKQYKVNVCSWWTFSPVAPKAQEGKDRWRKSPPEESPWKDEWPRDKAALRSRESVHLAMRSRSPVRQDLSPRTDPSQDPSSPRYAFPRHKSRRRSFSPKRDPSSDSDSHLRNRKPLIESKSRDIITKKKSAEDISRTDQRMLKKNCQKGSESKNVINLVKSAKNKKQPKCEVTAQSSFSQKDLEGKSGSYVIATEEDSKCSLEGEQKALTLSSANVFNESEEYLELKHDSFELSKQMSDIALAQNIVTIKSLALENVKEKKTEQTDNRSEQASPLFNLPNQFHDINIIKHIKNDKLPQTDDKLESCKAAFILNQSAVNFESSSTENSSNKESSDENSE